MMDVVEKSIWDMMVDKMAIHIWVIRVKNQMKKYDSQKEAEWFIQNELIKCMPTGKGAFYKRIRKKNLISITKLLLNN